MSGGCAVPRPTHELLLAEEDKVAHDNDNLANQGKPELPFLCKRLQSVSDAARCDRRPTHAQRVVRVGHARPVPKGRVREDGTRSDLLARVINIISSLKRTRSPTNLVRSGGTRDYDHDGSQHLRARESGAYMQTRKGLQQDHAPGRCRGEVRILLVRTLVCFHLQSDTLDGVQNTKPQPEGSATARTSASAGFPVGSTFQLTCKARQLHPTAGTARRRTCPRTSGTISGSRDQRQRLAAARSALWSSL